MPHVAMIQCGVRRNVMCCVQVAATFSEAAQGMDAAQQAPGTSGRSAAERFGSVVTQLLVSHGDRWAALVTPQLTHLYDLKAMKYHGRLPALEVRSLLAVLESPCVPSCCHRVALFQCVILAQHDGREGTGDRGHDLLIRCGDSKD